MTDYIAMGQRIVIVIFLRSILGKLISIYNLLEIHLK